MTLTADELKEVTREELDAIRQEMNILHEHAAMAALHNRNGETDIAYLSRLVRVKSCLRQAVKNFEGS